MDTLCGLFRRNLVFGWRDVAEIVRACLRSIQTVLWSQELANRLYRTTWSKVHAYVTFPMGFTNDSQMTGWFAVVFAFFFFLAALRQFAPRSLCLAVSPKLLR